MAELHQRSVVKVHGFFNVYKKNGWETIFEETFWLYNPTFEQIESRLNEIQRKLIVWSNVSKAGELDRKVVCEAIYPIVHENSLIGNYGDRIRNFVVDDDGYLTNYMAKLM